MDSKIIIVNWKVILETAQLDSKVGIRIAQLTNNPTLSMYITEIAAKQKIKAHYHHEGMEIYSILEGAGVLHTAIAISETELANKMAMPVMSGDFFEIPAKVVHQLENTGETPLILIFGCKPNHLTTDRVIVGDIP